MTIEGLEAARIGELEVKPGERSAPPDLQNLELDALRARVEVRDPKGNPLPGISVHFWMWSGRGSTKRTRFCDARGVTEIVLPRDAKVTVEIGRLNTPRRGTASISVPNASFPLVITYEAPPK